MALTEGSTGPGAIVCVVLAAGFVLGMPASLYQRRYEDVEDEAGTETMRLVVEIRVFRN